MRVTPVPCLSDNYAYIVVCEETGACAVVDVSEAPPVRTALDAVGSQTRPVAILSTHHHFDHVGGNEELISALGPVPVYAHASDRGRVPGQTVFLEEGDSFEIGRLAVSVLHIPGHTTGAVAYVVTDRGGGTSVFTGDTLFVAGCGRLFEGTPAMMHASLGKLAGLPGAALVYCGHEYTEANLRFAHHVEPGNTEVARSRESASARRAEGQPTVPSTMAGELATNPFLRVDSPEIRATLSIAAAASGAEALGVIRAAKDAFRG